MYGLKDEIAHLLHDVGLDAELREAKKTEAEWAEALAAQVDYEQFGYDESSKEDSERIKGDIMKILEDEGLFEPEKKAANSSGGKDGFEMGGLFSAQEDDAGEDPHPAEIEYLIMPSYDWFCGEFAEDTFRASFSDEVVFDKDYNADGDISDGIRKKIEGDEFAQKLAEYVPDSLSGKIDHISLRWDAELNRLEVIVTLAEGVDPDKIEPEVRDYIDAQMSDGWGEGFEQEPVYEARIDYAYNEETDDLQFSSTGQWSDEYDEEPWYTGECRVQLRVSFYDGGSIIEDIDIRR